MKKYQLRIMHENGRIDFKDLPGKPITQTVQVNKNKEDPEPLLPMNFHPNHREEAGNNGGTPTVNQYNDAGNATDEMLLPTGMIEGSCGKIRTYQERIELEKKNQKPCDDPQNNTDEILIPIIHE
ncbi:MAG: hypothetical protein WD097_09785 [Balneolales bacterium]